MLRCPCCNFCWKGALGLFAVAAVVAIAVGFAPQEKPAAKPSDKPAAAAPKSNPYPLDVCIVSGEKLGGMGKPVVKEYDGREVRFCCNGCIGEFEKDKAAMWKKVDEKIIEQQLPHYPLKNCVVMERASLNGEGEEKPVNYVYNNRLVRFCCGGCVKDFKAEPAKFMAKVDAAVIKEQKPKYPLDTDVVTGEKLSASAVDHVFGVSLVRLNNQDSVAKFNAEPQKYIAKLHEAWMAKQPHDKKDDGKKTDKDDHQGHDHGK